MLEDFLYRNDIDLLCIQEITNLNIKNIEHYESHVNIGEKGRGTALIVKEAYILSDVRHMPSGRGISANFHGCRVNIYAPFGASRRREMEAFYNTDVPQLILNPSPTLLLVGDFKCVISKMDCTGTPAIRRALRCLVEGLDLQHTWTQNDSNRQYTHYTSSEATRIDRIYATLQMIAAKKSIEITAVAFSDHHAVILQTEVMQSRHTYDGLKEEWNGWTTMRHKYTSSVEWWCRHTKQRIRTLFRKI
jgi:exonuclease III